MVCPPPPRPAGKVITLCSEKHKNTWILCTGRKQSFLTLNLVAYKELIYVHSSWFHCTWSNFVQEAEWLRNCGRSAICENKPFITALSCHHSTFFHSASSRWILILPSQKNFSFPLQVLQAKFCMHISPVSCVLHVTIIWSLLSSYGEDSLLADIQA